MENPERCLFGLFSRLKSDGKIILKVSTEKSTNNKKSILDKFLVDNNLELFLENVEFLSINTPKTKEYILDTPQFEKMKDGVFIVNTARGGVLNEVTLLDFIESGKIAGAALDVFENEPTPELPLLMNPNLSLSPHLGGNTLDAQEKIGTELALQIIDIKKKL